MTVEIPFWVVVTAGSLLYVLLGNVVILACQQPLRKCRWAYWNAIGGEPAVSGAVGALWPLVLALVVAWLASMIIFTFVGVLLFWPGAALCGLLTRTPPST